MIDYSALFGTSSGLQVSPLLQAIYGTSSGSANGANALTQLTLAEHTETQQVAQTAKQPQVSRDIATFTQAVNTATSPASLLQNPTVLKVLLTVNGLADQVPYTALAQKALLSNVNDSGSLARSLGSAAWLNATQTYDFANKGLSNLQATGTIAQIANQYAEITWRNSLNTTTPGLSNAIKFRDAAASLKTADQIISDPDLTDVFVTAFNLSSEFANQDLTQQENDINNRIDFTKLSKPSYVEGIVQNYLLAKANSAAASTVNIEALAVQSNGLVV